MYFEERLLQPYAQTLVAEELEEGSAYFDAAFLDRNMLLPSMESYVFIGRDLDPEAESGLYFQDFASYSSGILFQAATQDAGATFLLESEENLHLFDYERALDQLLWCSLRRQGAPEGEPLRFEGRQLGPQAEPIPPGRLEEGLLYFSLVFRDHSRLIPALEPYIFLGRDLRSGDHKRFYFQDLSSHRKGARLDANTKIDQAQFLAEGEAEAGYFYDYERALEELMRCSLRRREAGLRITAWRPEAVRVSEGVSDEPKLRSFRFEDPELQQRLITELRRIPVAFELRDDNAAVYANADARAVGSAASRIQESCFRGYFLLWEKDLGSAYQFKDKMKELGLPCLVEYADDRVVFFLPKGSKDLHDQIVESLFSAG